MTNGTFLSLSNVHKLNMLLNFEAKCKYTMLGSCLGYFQEMELMIWDDLYMSFLIWTARGYISSKHTAAPQDDMVHTPVQFVL